MDAPQHDCGPAHEALRRRTIVLVGLMGAGKTSVGKRLAAELDLPFRDGDEEIEKAAGLTVPEIFELYGEERFREGERRVMARLLKSPPHVLATGGGAFMDEATRAAIKDVAVSVWLKADIEVLAKRVGRKDTRPLLAGKDPLAVLTELAAVRYPAYAQADIAVETGDAAHQVSVDQVIRALTAYLEEQPK